jgi:hypothetical protein
MKFSSYLAVAVGALLSLSAGCKDAVQPEPPVIEAPVAAPAPPLAAPPDFPALARPGEIYNEGAVSIYGYPGSDAYHDGRLVSRYVLYQDSSFALQFSSPRSGIFEYLGRYSRADSVITFDWDGWSIAGPWGATGTLRGDSLDVKYNIIMQLSDFVDGVYVPEQGTQ